MTTDRHVSALMVDALALDALDHDTAARVRDHLARCARCSSDQKDAAELREQFARSVLPRGLRVRPPRRWAWLAVPAVVVAVAVLILALWRPPERDDALAIKGEASWRVFANRDGQTFAVRDETELAPGDRIRFVVLPDGARYLLVVSVDGRGAVTIYYPYNGAHSASIEGDRFELAGSIVLDDAPGPERIYAILSDHPVASAVVTAQLRQLAGGGATAIRAMRALPLPVRAQLSLVFEKASQ
jgi:hypothetical protein